MDGKWQEGKIHGCKLEPRVANKVSREESPPTTLNFLEMTSSLAFLTLPTLPPAPAAPLQQESQPQEMPLALMLQFHLTLLASTDSEMSILNFVMLRWYPEGVKKATWVEVNGWVRMWNKG